MQQVPSCLLETAPDGLRYSEYVSERRTFGYLHAFVSEEIAAGGKRVRADYYLRNIYDIEPGLAGIIYEYVFFGGTQERAA